MFEILAELEELHADPGHDLLQRFAHRLDRIQLSSWLCHDGATRSSSWTTVLLGAAVKSSVLGIVGECALNSKQGVIAAMGTSVVLNEPSLGLSPHCGFLDDIVIDYPDDDPLECENNIRSPRLERRTLV